MPRRRHLKTVFKNEPIVIEGHDPIYTVSRAGGITLVIERFADGWYQQGELEQHWTNKDVAAIGLLIEQKMKKI